MFENQPNPDPNFNATSNANANSNSNSNFNPHPKLQETEKLPHINNEIDRREILEDRLEDAEFQRSFLESSLNVAKTIKRKVWNAR